MKGPEIYELELEPECLPYLILNIEKRKNIGLTFTPHRNRNVGCITVSVKQVLSQFSHFAQTLAVTSPVHINL
jgi:hypothetical protein